MRCNQQVCFTTAFNLIYAVDKKRTFQLLREAKRNFTDSHGRAKAARVSYNASDFCRQWLDRWVMYAGESMPMANGTPTHQTPDWMTKEWVYKLYIEECEERCSKGEDFVFV